VLQHTASVTAYKLVKLATGVHSVHSLQHRETFHPVIGPVAEAQALYIHQIQLPELLKDRAGEFVIWDVGLGAAANVLTVLRATREIACALRVLSFDHTLEPLEFALQNAESLGYLTGYEDSLRVLVEQKQVRFSGPAQKVEWEIHVADFPTLLLRPEAKQFPKPHVIMFDAFSPATNAAMWTLPLFSNLFRLLDPGRPCVIPTYSRSTMLRVTLLLAGFFVGAGHATGEKEETTIAANQFGLIKEPLDQRWLQRVRRSTSAEPMRDALYRQSPLSTETLDQLQGHPQFL
jgi:tRNA U34 5-methylaminomethyl-2-thiouridine-forming methyltransferase MnmC